MTIMLTKKYSRSEATLCLHYTYFVTIHSKQKKNYVDKRDIDHCISLLHESLPNITIIKKVYETSGKYNQLHSHLIIKSDKRVQYIKNSLIHDFRLYWKPVFKLHNLISYLEKDVHNPYEQEQILATNQYKLYAFRDEKETNQESLGNV